MTHASMPAVLVAAAGGPEQLHLGEAPRPALLPHGLLVRVHATALNRADLLQRAGKYPPPPGASPLLGLEVAGTVEAVAEGVAAWQVGDRVMALLPGGGYAAYAAMPAAHAMPIPEALSMEEAAAIPEAFLTAFQALFWLGGLQPGGSLLVHAGASGVGTAAIQLARAVEATVYVTASAGKHDLCRALGAAEAIDYRREDFAARIAELTAGAGVNLVVDFIGAPYLAANVRVLAGDGCLVVLATMGGARAEGFDLRALFARRGRLVTSTLRSRSDAYKARLTADFAAFALPRFADGTLRPVVDSVFDWADVAAAHRRMEANANAGKIVLRVSTSDA